jgi:hypothetical protein
MDASSIVHADYIDLKSVIGVQPRFFAAAAVR